jgi:putative alpha-1,2-mannosidase
LFDEVRIHLNRKYYSGEKFEIRVKGDPSKNHYIQSAKLNGTDLARCWLPWNRLVKGGSLELIVGAQPNPAWGTNETPPSASDVAPH